MNFKSFFPYALVIIALTGLFLQYRSYKHLTGGCSCDKEKEPGMI